jgi:hypothetical protein
MYALRAKREFRGLFNPPDFMLDYFSSRILNFAARGEIEPPQFPFFITGAFCVALTLC